MVHVPLVNPVQEQALDLLPQINSLQGRVLHLALVRDLKFSWDQMCFRLIQIPCSVLDFLTSGRFNCPLQVYHWSSPRKCRVKERKKFPLFHPADSKLCVTKGIVVKAKTRYLCNEQTGEVTHLHGCHVWSLHFNYCEWLSFHKELSCPKLSWAYEKAGL